MTDTYLSLLKGIISKLKATSAVTDLVGTRIYSDVPQQETFPYVVVSVNSTDFSTKTFSGMQHAVDFNVFSRKKDPQECGNIRKEIYTALNKNENGVTLDEGHLALLEYVTGRVFKDNDGITWHSLGQFTAIIT